MKVLFVDQDIFGNEDMKEAFCMEGHTVILWSGKNGLDALSNPGKSLSVALRQEIPDVVFSINYFPTVSDICNREGIRYISWVFDSPYVWLYSKTVFNSCNQVYVYEKELCLEFRDARVDTVHYLPLAVNSDRLDALLTSQEAPNYQYDISFVGSLYVEQDDPFERMISGLSDFARGYLDAVMAAQMKVQGYDFVEEVLGPVMDELHQAFPLDPEGMESREYLYAQYVINRRLTSLERIDLLNAVAEKNKLDMFTDIKDFRIPNVCSHGHADYFLEMPWIFNRSRINLNISRRGIKSGIPLRAMDIMGSRGFLLSNFQADFLDSFVPGEDFVYYESRADLLEKTDYYLRHEDERQAIAQNGYAKVAAGHTCRHRVREMLS